MLTVKELRIGNLVNHYEWRKLAIKLTPDVGAVTAINGKTFSVGPYQRVKAEGIPLTPAWLEKCGFGRSGEVPGKWGKSVNGRYVFELVEFAHGYKLTPHWNAAGVQYVHQLQNLYFALTGDELQIQYHG